jgi:cytochrome c oxidase cbb3-type subunit 3
LQQALPATFSHDNPPPIGVIVFGNCGTVSDLIQINSARQKILENSDVSKQEMKMPLSRLNLALSRLALVLVLLVPGVAAQASPDGKQLFSEHCASCHGYDGKGGVGVPLALPSFLASVTDDYIKHTVRHGRPGRVMPAFNELSDAQLQAIIDHVRSFAPGTAKPKPSMAVIHGDAKHGKQLFGQYCAACHGANGEGGKGTGVTYSRPRDLPIIAPALNNPGFLIAASDALIKQTLMQGREGTPMISFLKQGLKEKDIDDIVSYIRTFETTLAKDRTSSLTSEDAVIMVESPYDFTKTVENVKAAAKAANYRIIRVQGFDSGLVDKKHENPKRTIVYFCNFQLLNDVLAVDPRVGLFLPCRVTIVEEAGKVKVMAINPRKLSSLYNNAELDKACDEMHAVYEAILEEATL